jgi:hypothetical protein
LRQEDKILFAILKKEIVVAMKLTYPGINPEISDWKGQEITDFQEDLLIKVNGRLSEKWFYTHMKAVNPSLPRIDVLNMLCKYAGYTGWDDFRFKNAGQIPPSLRPKNKATTSIVLVLFLVITIILLLIVSKIKITRDYRFTFIDSDTGEPIRNSKIQADLLLKNESPVSYFCDSEGSLVLRTNQTLIRIAVRAPYYLADTITRILRKFEREEQVKLHTDVYPLLIRSYSQSDADGWQKKREQMERIISDNALICQVSDISTLMGMELYNKKEFIDWLTMPTSGLSKVEILDVRYDDGKIVILRFTIKNK